MAIPKPEPSDWQKANAQVLQATDREVLAMLRDSYGVVQRELRALIASEATNLSSGIRRAQLEASRSRLMAEQAKVFERLGDIVSARRLRAASRAARLSVAADAALLKLVGRGETAQILYDAALQASNSAIQVAIARLGGPRAPLSQRIYSTRVWMDGRLGRLINATLASGLNARTFARTALDWFNPNTPGGVRYAALRLARTEINNAFHAISVQKAADKPWVTEMDWHLSKSHPKPDKCNVLADASPYPADNVPMRPHPQCMCYVTERTPDEDEWIDRFMDGEFDDYLDGELEKAGVTSEPEKPSAQQSVATPSIPEPPKVDPNVAKRIAVSEAGGYKAGTWVQEFGNEREIRTMMASIELNAPPERRAQQEAANGPDWVRKLAESLAGPNDDGTVTYTNGPHEVLFAGTLTPERHGEFLGYVDRLQTGFPTGRSMRIRLGKSSEFGKGVGGETVLGTGTMWLNENIMERDTWGGMPVSKTVSSAQYVLAHEWGHSLSEVDEAREKGVHDHAVAAGGMTRYGTFGDDGVRNPAEGYAEAFAEWALTNGQTLNKAAQEYAKHFGWKERFGTD